MSEDCQQQLRRGAALGGAGISASEWRPLGALAGGPFSPAREPDDLFFGDRVFPARRGSVCPYSEVEFVRRVVDQASRIGDVIADVTAVFPVDRTVAGWCASFRASGSGRVKDAAGAAEWAAGEPILSSVKR